MNRALVSQTVIFLVLTVATFTVRSNMWQTMYAVFNSIGSAIVAVAVLVRIDYIPVEWRAALTVAYIVKNVSLLVLVSATYYSNRHEKGSVHGAAVTDPLRALRDTCDSALAASVAPRASSKEDEA